MSTIELTTKIRELKELKAMAEEIAAEITSIEDPKQYDADGNMLKPVRKDRGEARWSTPVYVAANMYRRAEWSVLFVFINPRRRRLNRIEKTDHIIWSDQIDYEDWREEMESEYPDENEQWRIDRAYEINDA